VGDYGDGLQRYWVDASAHACVPGYSTDGWAHYTLASGCVLRGSLYVDSSRNVYYANNDGLLSSLSGDPNEAQQAIVAAARTTSAAAYGSKWVSDVYQNAGLGTFTGNACDFYAKYCTSSDQGELEAGMVIAVSRDASDPTYGDSAIYMGNGNVCQCTGGAVKTMTLSAWMSSYGTLVTPKWGWLGNLVIA